MYLKFYENSFFTLYFLYIGNTYFNFPMNGFNYPGSLKAFHKKEIEKLKL